MEQKVDLKLCGVCGDKALGYNFNAVTCESCKAFFRRNALAKKAFRCPFSDQCEITTVTRRFCQKCRLQKCFAIGMRKEYIMSEEDKVRKREKIEQNRAKKRAVRGGHKGGFKKVKREINHEEDSQDYVENDMDYSNSKDDMDDEVYSNNNHTNIVSVINYNSSDGNSKLPHAEESNSFNNELSVSPESNNEVVQDESMIRSMLNPTPNGSVHNSEEEGNSSSPLSSLVNNNDTHCNHNMAGTSKSTTNTTDATKDIMEEIQRTPVEAYSIESILCEAIKLEYEAYTSLANCHSNSRELNDAERAKLNELIVAHKALGTPLDDDLNTLIGEDCRFKSKTQQALRADPGLVDVINLTAIAIRRLIKMAKKINAFKNMCQEDQVALLKGGCTEMMILRSAMNYDPTKQLWRIPHSQESLSLNVDILKLAEGNVYQEHERFIKTFDPKWSADENIILILCAIALFTPDRPKVIHQDVIKLEQNSYYYLLRRYLESVYPGCEAKSTFLKLIQKIGDLHKFNEEIVNVYLDVNPSEVEPLLLEIFDLKH